MRKFMFYFFAGVFALIVIALIFLALKIKFHPDKHNLKDSVDKAVKEYIEKDNTYGIVVGIIKDNQVYINGYGSIIKDAGVLPDKNTAFELASVSKLFTTATLQILADKGVVKLDDVISTFLPNEVSLPKHAQSISLRQLATHTSGFPNIPDNMLKKMQDSSNPYKDLHLSDMYKYLEICGEMGKQGTVRYSNFGMGLLGHLLELRTNTKYETLVKQQLLDPLGMDHTFISPIDSITIAQGYDIKGNPNPIWVDTVLTGAGSFLSTASDMVIFFKSHLYKTAPLNTSLNKTLIPQQNTSMGLGWILPDWLDNLLGMKNVAWHNGGAGGYSSFISLNQADGMGVIILSNKAKDVTNFGRKISIIAKTQSWK